MLSKAYLKSWLIASEFTPEKSVKEVPGNVARGVYGMLICDGKRVSRGAGLAASYCIGGTNGTLRELPSSALWLLSSNRSIR